MCDDRVAAEREPGTKRVIVIFPDLHTLQPLIKFRKKWDPLAEDIAPHLTLVFPFADNTISATDLHTHAVEVTKGIEPFMIRLAGISGSDDEYVFINVKAGNDVLIALHDRLYTGPLKTHLSRVHTFVPHVTIGRVSDRTGFQAALSEAADLAIDAEVLVRKLSIYAIGPGNARRIESEVPLGGG